MQKILLSASLLFAAHVLHAQQTDSPARSSAPAAGPNATIKWAPAGLLAGNIALHGEYRVRPKSALTAKIGLPVTVTHTSEYDGSDARLNLKTTSFLAGYRMYLSKRQLRGLYAEPYLKYVKNTADGIGNGSLGFRNITLQFDNQYEGFGVGALLGAQFLVGKRFVIDLFLIGPEINSATNRFVTTEVTNAIPWTQVEAQEAERDVKDFIDDFPFVRNRTTVTVDRNAKSVRADFKGALPGIRTGISLGIAL